MALNGLRHINLRNLLIISPLGFMTYRHWTNGIVFLFFVLSLIYLWRNRSHQTGSPKTTSSMGSDLWVVACLAGLVTAVGIGQLLRQHFYAPNFDAPLRLAMCIPIYLALRKGWLTSEQNHKPITVWWMTVIFPLTLIWTLVCFLLTAPNEWGVHRGTYFVDPLTFGSFCLLFSLLCLSGITGNDQQLKRYQLWLCAFAILAGLFMAVVVNSRTGWLNLPVFLILWAYFHLRPQWGGKLTLIATSMIVVIVVGLLLSFPGLLNKFMTAYQELVDYKWDEMNPDQSVTMRISFYRMAFFYFIQNPIQGWGDLGWQSLMNHPDLIKFASSYTRESTAQGFHNEIITNTIRSGIWGLIASMLFYGVPIKRAIRGLVQVDQKLKIVSFNLLIFILHLFFAGLTTEVTNLVFLCSFIGISLSVMMAEQGKIESIKNKNQFLLK